MLSRGNRAGVAVSGGADSIFLLSALKPLADVTVLHLNHGLRGAASDADEAFVREAAAVAGVPIAVERVWGLAGPNLEEKARQARYEFFARAAVNHNLNCVATGHTLDDQAETFLLHLLRGAGGTGLAGIHPVSPDGIIRPLLEIERSEIKEYLCVGGIAWREDESNGDPVFARNRVRHNLLPLLEREWNPAIRRVLSRTADVLTGEESYWRQWTNHELSTAAHSTADGQALVLDLAPLRLLHEAALRRLIRAAVERVRGDLRRIEHDHILRLVRLCQAHGGSGGVRLPGLTAIRSFDQMLLTSGPPGLRSFPNVVVSQPGPVQIPGGRGALYFQVVTPATDTGYNTGVGQGPGSISPPVTVRGWRPGDSYHPLGHSRSWKLKDLFHEHKVPSWERHSWPIIESDGQIVWVRRFGAAAGVMLNWTCEDEMRMY